MNLRPPSGPRSRPATPLLGAVLLVVAIGGCGPDAAPGDGASRDGAPTADGAPAGDSPSDKVATRPYADATSPGSDPGAPDSDTGAPDSDTGAPDSDTPATEAGTEAPPAATPSRDRITPEGWGPLRIGMTRQQVVDAAGEDANPDAVGGPEPEACDEWRPTGAPEGMLVMLEEHRLTRITYFGDGGITTPAGLGVGAERDAVVAAHGDAAEVLPHRYVEGEAAYITVWTSGPDTGRPRGIRYEVGHDGRVTRIHAGGPSIRYVEGCL